jgi:hypothetical protein
MGSFDDDPLNETSNDVFHLRGRLSYDDALSALRLGESKSRKWERLYRAGAFVGLLIGVELAKPAFAATPALMVLYLLVACVLLLFPAARRWHRRRQLRLASDAGLGIFRYAESTLSPAGIESRNEFGQSTLAWDAFGELRYNQSVAVLSFAEQSGSAIIARSKLDDPARWPALMQMISKQILAREE